jgi:hypothetical protein
MAKCNRCGECCIWYPIALDEGLSTEVREYAVERSEVLEDGFFLVRSPCRHLVEFDGVDVTTCDIYKTRPAVCRAFNGKRRVNNKTFYVPKGCSLCKK